MELLPTKIFNWLH